MATYDSLLIDAGGGVIDHDKQSDRWPGATVIIGLGGTGADAVVKLKKEVYRQLKPDDINAVTPEYGSIKYLIIDAEFRGKGYCREIDSDIDRTNDFLDIALSKEVIQGLCGTVHPMKGGNRFEWLDYEHIAIDDNMQVWSAGIRQIGRLLLVCNAQRIYQRIKTVLQEALWNSDGKLHVHICAGISGGTGGGIFLDVCYLVREALKEIGKPETLVCGHFFLPDVNLSVPAVASDPLISDHIQVNGYAALQELDYCMNYCRNLDSFRMDYGFMQIENSQKPVDMCFLVSAKDESGNTIKNGYQYAISVVVEFIIHSMTKDSLLIGLERMQSEPRNFPQQLHGANPDYNALGVSVAEMASSDIYTYLGYRLFESYAEIFDRTPAEKERDEFLQEAQLTYEDIGKALSKGCLPQICFPQGLDARLFQQRGVQPFVNFAGEYLARNCGELEKNSKPLMEAMKEYSVPDYSTSLIGRTFKELCEKYVANPDYGPFYAQRMLYGARNQNLIHAVDGFIARNRIGLEDELEQSRRRTEEYEGALDRMQNANPLTRNSRFSDYLDALNNLYVHYYRLRLLESLDRVLRDYRQQLDRMNYYYFHILTTMLDTLQKTFQENGRALAQETGTADGCTWKMIFEPAVRESLDAEAERLDLRQTFYDMMRTMTEGYTKWKDEDEKEIARLISDFILRTFRNVDGRTVMDCLKEKFRTDNPMEEIIQKKLREHSGPWFPKCPEYQDGLMTNILTIPYESVEIKKAAYAYADKGREIYVKESGITDKISMWRFHIALPLYAYQGILELQNRYERDHTPGRHLYERGAVDWNQWLPSPVPASFQKGMPIARIENRNKALIAEFEKAEKAGVVVAVSPSDWDILVTEAYGAEAIEKAFIETEGGYEINGRIDLNKLNALIVRLETEAEKQKKSAKPLRIESRQAYCADSGRQVMLDFYLKSPILNKAVHDELEKRETMARRITQLRTLLENTAGSAEEQQNFFHAIFTGVLFYGDNISYTYDEQGTEKIMELQNRGMPLGNTGAYQAFLNFKSMDADIKGKIVAETEERMREKDSPEVKAAVEKLNANMPKRIAICNMLHDETDPLHEELEKFYGQFMNALREFAPA